MVWGGLGFGFERLNLDLGSWIRLNHDEQLRDWQSRPYIGAGGLKPKFELGFVD